MPISARAPEGGIAAQIGARSRPLLLRNEEIERFEAQYDLGIFAMFERLLGAGGGAQARHVRDLVALGLIGAGMSDASADEQLRALGPAHNVALRIVARDLVAKALMPPGKTAKKQGGRGTRSNAPAQKTATTSPDASAIS